MDVPLDPTLANIFLRHHETASKDVKPNFYKIYVHGIFVLFEKPEQNEPSVDYMDKT